MSQPDISIVVPTYERPEEVAEAVKDLLSQSYENFELVILDQSLIKHPEIKKMLESINDSRLRYFHIGPPSLPAARNFGLHAAKAPIVLFLDDDIMPGKDLIKFHLQAFAEHPGLSAVGGRVMQEGFPIKKERLQFDEFGVSHGVFTATEAGYTNAFAGGNHALKVADALKVGGYDTRYYRIAFREESDMGLKMVKAGMKIYYEPRAEIFHLNTARGGLRHYTDLFDTVDFYRNDLFFVLRSVAPRHIPKALYRKFMEYVHVRPLKKGLKRLVFYKIGFWTAVWRLMFGRQIVAREIK